MRFKAQKGDPGKRENDHSYSAVTAKPGVYGGGVVRMNGFSSTQEDVVMMAPDLQNKEPDPCTGDPFLDMPEVRTAINTAFHMSVNARDFEDQMFQEWENESTSESDFGSVPMHPADAPDYKEAFFRVDNGIVSPIKLSVLPLNISSGEHGINDATQAFFHTHPTQRKVRGHTLNTDRKSASTLEIPAYVISETDVFVINSLSGKNRFRRSKLEGNCNS